MSALVYYQDNRADARREKSVADLACGFDESRWSGPSYNVWPMERRLLAYLGECGVAWDRTEADNEAAWSALYDLVRA